MLRKFSIFLLLILLGNFTSAYSISAVGTDSRIRTFIYGKNDVFRVTTTYGYQTVIEFEEDEKLKTISTGNSGYFRITPLKNKIIVRGLQPNLLTNMLVITSKRTYQLELSTIINSLDDVMYVVRFYYPEYNDSNIKAMPMSAAPVPVDNVPVPDVKISTPSVSMQSFAPTPPPMPIQAVMPAPAPVIYEQQPPQTMVPPSPNPVVQQQPMPAPPQNSLSPGMNGNFAMQTPSNFNYNYTLTGPEELSPTEVFDDSARTYFKFNVQDTPNFRVMSPAGEVPANYQLSDGYYVVEAIAPEINVYFGSDKITVYNESYPR